MNTAFNCQCMHCSTKIVNQTAITAVAIIPNTTVQ